MELYAQLSNTVNIIYLILYIDEPEENQENSESENGNFTGKDDEDNAICTNNTVILYLFFYA